MIFDKDDHLMKLACQAEFLQLYADIGADMIERKETIESTCAKQASIHSSPDPIVFSGQMVKQALRSICETPSRNGTRWHAGW